MYAGPFFTAFMWALAFGHNLYVISNTEHMKKWFKWQV